MTLSQKLNLMLEALPQAMQEEALSFVEFLSQKANRLLSHQENREWTALFIESELSSSPKETIPFTEVDLIEW